MCHTPEIRTLNSPFFAQRTPTPSKPVLTTTHGLDCTKKVTCRHNRWIRVTKELKILMKNHLWRILQHHTTWLHTVHRFRTLENSIKISRTRQLCQSLCHSQSSPEPVRVWEFDKYRSSECSMRKWPEDDTYSMPRSMHPWFPAIIICRYLLHNGDRRGQEGHSQGSAEPRYLQTRIGSFVGDTLELVSTAYYEGLWNDNSRNSNPRAILYLAISGAVVGIYRKDLPTASCLVCIKGKQESISLS